jgi:hypothetical protein
MRILDEKGLTGIVGHLLEIVMFGGAAILIGLPVLLKWSLKTLYFSTGEKYWFLLPFLYITGIMAFVILFQTRKVFKTLSRKNPFMMDNVSSFKWISRASFAIALMYVVKIVFFNSFLTMVLAMVFVIAGLLSIVIAEVFHQAVIVKEENDLTI